MPFTKIGHMSETVLYCFSDICYESLSRHALLISEIDNDEYILAIKIWKNKRQYKPLLFNGIDNGHCYFISWWK